MTKRNIAGLVITCIIALMAITARIWPHFVPWGASIPPFILASHAGPTLQSPDVQREIKVYFNDAGGMHSGNCWTWVVEDHWLFGPHVVSEGYLLHEHSTGVEPVPITWSTNNNFTIKFRPSRYD